jgi:DNA-binding NarL/FixJ family response regulator
MAQGRLEKFTLGDIMSLTQRIRVLVLHRDPVAHAGLSVAFSNRVDFEVCAGPDSTLPHSADVVIADYSQGIMLAEAIANRPSRPMGPKVLVIAGVDREWEIRGALERGVRGYLLVGCSLEELLEGVRVVHRGARYLSPQVATRLAESISLEPLTSREEEVLRLVVEGLCNKAVGRRLGIAVGTVKSHLKSTFDKLKVESRTQAIAVVERRGLLQLSQQRTRDDARPIGVRSERHFHPLGVAFQEQRADSVMPAAPLHA